IDGKSTAVSVLRRTGIEHNAMRLNLRPDNTPQFAKASTRVVSQHEYELQIVGECIPELFVLLVLQKPGPHVAFGEPGNVRDLGHQWRFRSVRQVESPLQESQLQVDGRVGSFLAL